MEDMRFSTYFPLLAGVLIALLFAVWASAAEPATNSAPPQPLAINDFGNPAPQVPVLSAEQILAKVHLANWSEIAAGDLAREKGQSVLVRAYGDRLARDHRRADELLLRVADGTGVPVPPVGLKPAEKMPPLESTFGRAFDQTYVKMMIENHLRDIATLSAAYAQQPRGSKLRTYLGKIIPILKEHLQVAENIQRWI